MFDLLIGCLLLIIIVMIVLVIVLGVLMTKDAKETAKLSKQRGSK